MAKALPKAMGVLVAEQVSFAEEAFLEGGCCSRSARKEQVMMRLYQLVASPFAVRVRIALSAKGVMPEFAAPPDGLGSEAFRNITPLGKVPSLVCDDGTVIAESAVINEYLEEQFSEPALLPAALQERARARMVIQMTDAYVFARYLPLFTAVKAEGKSSSAVADGIEGVKGGLAALERVIDDETYAVGDALSLADCALVPVLFYLTAYSAEYFGAGDVLDHCPKLKRYWPRIATNPHVAQALAGR